MKHGKGEKEMSEEEVLEALEVIKEALMRMICSLYERQ